MDKNLEEKWCKLLNIRQRSLLESNAEFSHRVAAVFARHECINEDYREYPAPGCIGCFMIRKWTYYYSDGTEETVTVRERKTI